VRLSPLAADRASTVAAVIFDLDGTLIDSAPDIAAALNHALALEGLEALPLGVVRGMIGDGVKALIVKALARKGLADAGGLGPRLYGAFQTYARANPVVDTTVYPGMTELLAALKARGVRLGVCTNKTSALAELIIAALPFAGLIDVVTGGDGPYPPKPDPASLLAAVSLLGVSKSEAVYVGDMRVDWLTASAAGVRFLGVDHDFWDRTDPDLARLIPAAGAAALGEALLGEGLAA
jgi:phosphoglycolate phosphatase